MAKRMNSYERASQRPYPVAITFIAAQYIPEERGTALGKALLTTKNLTLLLLVS